MQKVVGVVYEEEDYAGFWRRLLTLLVDLFIVWSLVFVGFKLDVWANNHEYYDDLYCSYFSLALAYFYLTTMKASSFGSIGQRLTNTRIETIFGSRPGQMRMTLRLLFWLLGPVNFLTDLFFITVVKERRAIRDCFCNTIVVKRSATPIDKTAPIRVARIFAFGLNLMYESCNSNYS
ncbi:hypothetical protein BTA51_20390 [Hahella sp. CCB-MM4]|uniref:RDD family protein n=1 Tax=Hahella sp. (strain CCB-MM4) TaxID=1926491 RepID=UPI000B9B0E01|nr:RDD family protein [Hahella sp. CCB-MM4]OZG71638.1 hypothetical protein BTA51_20390 [Hahella sp. CCB-MM4]